MIIKIDENTVKEVTEKIIDLRPLRIRLVEIESELEETEKEPKMVENYFKEERLRGLREEKEGITNKLISYE